MHTELTSQMRGNVAAREPCLHLNGCLLNGKHCTAGWQQARAPAAVQRDCHQMADEDSHADGHGRQHLHSQGMPSPSALTSALQAAWQSGAVQQVPG
jgi:hypothetical protein